MHDAKPFWLVSLMQTIVIAVVAYIVALFLELVLLRISQLPHGALWTPELRAPFLFIMTIGIVGLLAIPYFMKEWDAGIRTFSMFSSTMLLAMAVLPAPARARADEGKTRYLTASEGRLRGFEPFRDPSEKARQAAARARRAARPELQIRAFDEQPIDLGFV
jgi:hypothetical protein